MKKFNLVAKTSWIAAGVLTAIISVPASAQWYAGAGVGSSNATGLNGSGAVTATTNVTISGGTRATSWKLYGGYQFTPNWGVEAQYTDLGKRSATATFSGAVVGSAGLNASVSQWGIAGTGTMPLSNNFYLLGKLGVSRNEIANVTATVGGVTYSGSGTSKTDLLAGLGVGYNFNKNVGVRFEYENFGKFSSNGGVGGSAIKGDNWGISLKYAF